MSPPVSASPASEVGLAAHLPRSFLSVPRPLEGAGGTRGVSSSSWDPGVFRPARGYPAIAGFNFSEEDLPNSPVQVPGLGFSKPDCGTWIRKLKSGDEVHDIYHSCDTLGCPVCVERVITKKASAFKERFDHYEDAKHQVNAVLVPGEYLNVHPRHIVFTLSPTHIAQLWQVSGKNHAIFLDMVRSELNDIIKETELIGGAVIYHPNRVKHPDTGLTGRDAKTLITREAKIAGNMTDESPSGALYTHIRKQDHPDRYYYFSPHFHSIIYGKIMDSKEFQERYPGWKYHNKGDVPNVGGLARYLFSHLAMIEGRHAVTWFGRLSSAVLGVDELKITYQDVICEKTGLPWVIWESIIQEEIGKNYQEPVTEYRSFFRVHKKRGLPKIKFGSSETTLRRMAPSGIREKGILAMAKYCDEFGRM